MLIRLIEPGTKNELYLDATQIRCIIGETVNPMICKVVTNLMTPKGFETFEAMGSADSIARLVNAAREGKNLLVQ